MCSFTGYKVYSVSHIKTVKNFFIDHSVVFYLLMWLFFFTTVEFHWRDCGPRQFLCTLCQHTAPI